MSAGRRRSVTRGSPTTLAPRDALVAVPAPPDTAAETVTAAGLDWVVGETLLDARTRAGKVQGRRTTVADVARRCPPPPRPTAGCGSPRAGSSPRTWSPTRAGARPAARPRESPRQRRRVRRQAGLAGTACRGRELADALGRPVAGRVLPRGRRPARSETPADRGGRDRPRRPGRDRGSTMIEPRRRTHAPTSSTCTSRGRSAPSPGPPVSGALRAVRARRAARCSSRGRSTPPGWTAPSSSTIAARGCCSTRSRPRPTAHSPERVSRSTHGRGTSTPCACGWTPVIRSTTWSCAPTRSARRTWRSAGCSARASPWTPSHRRGPRSHHPLVRHRPAEVHAAGRRDRRRDDAPRAPRRRRGLRRGGGGERGTR